jgi:hypothetical protein
MCREDEHGSLDIIYAETNEKLKRQFENLRALDAKANIAAGLSAVVLGIVASRKPWAHSTSKCNETGGSL